MRLGITFGIAALITNTGTATPLYAQTDNHGPGRVACDYQWAHLPKPAPEYQDFLRNCLETYVPVSAQTETPKVPKRPIIGQPQRVEGPATYSSDPTKDRAAARKQQTDEYSAFDPDIVARARQLFSGGEISYGSGPSNMAVWIAQQQQIRDAQKAVVERAKSQRIELNSRLHIDR